MTAPLGLHLLASLTGLLNGQEADLPHAYAAARTLAQHPPRGSNDCDPTYTAISALIHATNPIAAAEEDALATELQSEQNDRFGGVICARTDTSFLFGFALCYVFMTAVVGRDD